MSWTRRTPHRVRIWRQFPRTITPQKRLYEELARSLLLVDLVLSSGHNLPIILYVTIIIQVLLLIYQQLEGIFRWRGWWWWYQRNYARFWMLRTWSQLHCCMFSCHHYSFQVSLRKSHYHMWIQKWVYL